MDVQNSFFYFKELDPTPFIYECCQVSTCIFITRLDGAYNK